MPSKLSWLILLSFVLPPVAGAQPSTLQNPCNDSLFLKFKKIPRASLTAAERKFLEQKEKECAEFAKTQSLPKDTTVAATKPDPDALPKDAAAIEKSEPKLELMITDARNAARAEARQDSGASLNPLPEPKKEESTIARARSDLLSSNLPPIKSAQNDTTTGVSSEMEPLLTLRNAGIFAVVVAAVLGIALALGSITPSPF